MNLTSKSSEEVIWSIMTRLYEQHNAHSAQQPAGVGPVPSKECNNPAMWADLGDYHAFLLLAYLTRNTPKEALAKLVIRIADDAMRVN